ncbi:MAG: ubiquinol-cytochrome c reductase iron-sulfur subunit N-terminal domain-containing protein, partial [Planctomycetota bacterium]
MHFPSPIRRNHRRDLLKMAAASIGAVGAGIALPRIVSARPTGPKRANRMAVSTYSYWRYRDDSKLSIEDCINLAADAG